MESKVGQRGCRNPVTRSGQDSDKPGFLLSRSFNVGEVHSFRLVLLYQHRRIAKGHRVGIGSIAPALGCRYPLACSFLSVPGWYLIYDIGVESWELGIWT